MRVRIVKCNKCGQVALLRDGASSAQCEKCGATVTTEDAVREEQQRVRSFPNNTPLKIGMKGRFGGKDYQIIGRVVYGMVEEGEIYFWDEFQLLADDNDTLYLEYDEGQWKLMERFTPQNPIGPREAGKLHIGSYLSLNGSAGQVTQKSQATIHFVQGELTYAARVGDTLSYVDARYLNRFYTVEWTEEEIEFYRGRLLSEREVLTAFNLRSQIAALDARENRRKAQQVLAVVCLVLALLSLILWGISLTGGRVISRESVALTSIGPDGMRFGPFNLDPGQRVHRLVIRGAMTQASAWVAGVLEMGDGTELIGVQRDFWDESGHDSDGFWHESDLRAQTDFVVKQTNPCYINLYVEPDTPYGSYRTASYELRGGVMYPTYFLTYGIITLIFSIIFFCVSSSETLKKMAQSVEDD